MYTYIWLIPLLPLAGAAINGEVFVIHGGVAAVLGPPTRDTHILEKHSVPGVVPTLTWTPAGGELLVVESTRMPGNIV